MRAINRNKIIAVMSAIVVFMVSMCTYSAEANALKNTTMIYYIYDPDTGFFVDDYELEMLSTTSNTREIIGEDNREVDWSKNGVVKIMNTLGGYIGTGFVVGDHVIATAAHCIEDKRIQEILLFNTDGTVALSATPVEGHVPKVFVDANYYDFETREFYYDEDTYIKYDYGLITVEEDLSDYAHFNLGVLLDGFTPNIYVTGFSQDGNNGNTHIMYTSPGVIKNVFDEPLRLFFDADTLKGNSGGPVYITETRGNYTYNTVIAINAHGYDEDWEPNHHYNNGTRITTDHLHFYYNNSFLNWTSEE